MQTKAIKTNIIGFISIIAGAFMLVPVILAFLLNGISPLFDLGIILYLVFGIYFIFEGSAMRACKKWAWYAGVITFGIGLISNLIAVIFLGRADLWWALLVGAFILYSFFSDKDYFLKKQGSRLI